MESKLIRTWLHDLTRVGYTFPSIQNTTGTGPLKARVKRAAVCLTGTAECVEEVWAKNEKQLRKRFDGELDVFLFLSTKDTIITDQSQVSDSLRVKQARFYNATLNIMHQNALTINPHFPPTCKYNYNWTKVQKIEPIEQERLAQASCFGVVQEYAKKRNVRYQLLVRARADSVFTRLPKTFERDGQFSLNNTIIVPDEHHFMGVNDRFAVGPFDAMEYYMRRWHQLSLCLTEIVHPEIFLAFILRRNGIKVKVDSEISLVQVPHGEQQCH